LSEKQFSSHEADTTNPAFETLRPDLMVDLFEFMQKLLKIALKGLTFLGMDKYLICLGQYHEKKE